jgi:23S rRNA A2030 N6-methylase RlmJ
MTKLKKSWREKLEDSKDLPRVVEITGKMSTRWGTGTVCIPAPIEVDEIMRMVPRGKLITINQIREIVAKKHGATIG